MSFFDLWMKGYAIAGLPAMTDRERRVYKQLLVHLSGTKKHIRLFEYGSGFSTVYYAKFLKSKGISFELHSVDNNELWHNRVKEMVDQHGVSSSVNLYLSAFLPFWENSKWKWGVPVPCGIFAPSSTQEHQYIEMPSSLKGEFDLILIDGRFRQRCLKEAIKSLSPNGIVIIHDAHKTHYTPPQGILPWSHMVNGGKFYAWQKNSQSMWLGSNQPIADSKIFNV